MFKPVVRLESPPPASSGAITAKVPQEMKIDIQREEPDPKSGGTSAPKLSPIGGVKASMSLVEQPTQTSEVVSEAHQPPVMLKQTTEKFTQMSRKPTL